MAGYGYRYQSYTTYNTGGSRTEEAFGPSIRRPFDPFVPNPNPNRSSDGYVTRKTIVPVTSGPSDDEYKHSSPTEAYPTRDDDEWYRQTSPVRGRPQKVDEFLPKHQNKASRPARLIPVTTNQSPRSTGYNGADGYGDYGSYNKEGHKPIGSTIQYDNYDGYNGAKGYDECGNYSNKEGHKPISSPIRNDNYDGNGYGDYGNYSNKGGLKPVGSPIRNDNYDRYRPAENYSAMEPNRTTSNGLTRPNISSGWTAQPKKGTQLSEATNDIGKAMELLKDAAKLASSGHPAGVHGSVNGHGGEYKNRGGHNGYAYPNDSYDSYQHRNGGVDRLISPGNGSQLSEPINKLGKPMVGTTPYPRPTMPTEPTTLNKDDYRETSDKRENTWRSDAPMRYGNKNLTIDSKEAEKKYSGKRV